MANQMNEDEKNEKIIRSLLKLTPNRRCINCNSLGPQYVCTNFWTFVCTTCSGMHREYTHRVKSVSMAKFTPKEVAALKEGGNERAREFFFKDWDPQQHSLPDSSNIERLRTFIRDVYVNKRYARERTSDKPPRFKLGDRDDSYENRRVVSHLAVSWSPPIEEAYVHHYGEITRPSWSKDEKRSASEHASRYGYRRSPVHFEVVDNRFRDDRFGNSRTSEDRKFPDGESMMVVRSPDHQKKPDKSNLPLVRPVRDIFGENAPRLCIGEPPNGNGGKFADGISCAQRTGSSCSLASDAKKSVELKGEKVASLIDFDADPQPTDAGAGLSAQPARTTTEQLPIQSTTPSMDGDIWASFDLITNRKFSQSQSSSNLHTLQSELSPLVAPPAATGPSAQWTNAPGDQSFAIPKNPVNANTFESLLSQLSAPATVPGGNHSSVPIGGSPPATTPIGDMSVLSSTGSVPKNTPLKNIAVRSSGDSSSAAADLPATVAGVATPVGNMLMPIVNGGASEVVSGRMISMSPTSGDASLSIAIDAQSTMQFASSVGGALGNQESLTVPTRQASQAASRTAQDTGGGVAPPPVSVESSVRKELPEDLFTATYSSVPGPVMGWQTGASHGMPFGAQYHTGMFPSMESFQGELPNMAAWPGLLRTASLGALSSELMVPQSPSYTARSPSFLSVAPPSMYVGRQAPYNLPVLGSQIFAGFGGEGTSNTDQELAHGYSQPATPNSFTPRGGNPFG